MADKNIQMSQRNTENTAWDNLYPITKGTNVLGLGTAAFTASTAYATAAQGLTADNTAAALTTHTVISASEAVKGHVELATSAETTTGTDTTRAVHPAGLKAVMDAHKADYVRQPAFTATTGSANTYAISTDPAPTSYVDGMSAYLDINVTNTGTSTLNWNGLGAKSIVNGKGVALTAGKLPANCLVGVRYNASTSSFQLLGEGGEGTALAGDIISGKTATVDSGFITGTGANAKRYASGTTGAIPLNTNLTINLTFTPSKVTLRGDYSTSLKDYQWGLVINGAFKTITPSTTIFNPMTQPSGNTFIIPVRDNFAANFVEWEAYE